MSANLRLIRAMPLCVLFLVVVAFSTLEPVEAETTSHFTSSSSNTNSWSDGNKQCSCINGDCKCTEAHDGDTQGLSTQQWSDGKQTCSCVTRLGQKPDCKCVPLKPGQAAPMNSFSSSSSSFNGLPSNVQFSSMPTSMFPQNDPITFPRTPMSMGMMRRPPMSPPSMQMLGIGQDGMFQAQNMPSFEGLQGFPRGFRGNMFQGQRMPGFGQQPSQFNPMFPSTFQQQQLYPDMEPFWQPQQQFGNGFGEFPTRSSDSSRRRNRGMAEFYDRH